jgi:diketogulonate reductase-like aldo/keto reductase
MITEQTVHLNNGVSVPTLGYGLWKSPANDVTYQGIRAALEHGYRHFDGAAIYGNEAIEGKAIKDSGIPREQLFITDKLWNDFRGYDSTLSEFDRTLRELGLDYLDLYLIHWPDHQDLSLNTKTWKAFERLNEEGRVKAIGVSNFSSRFLLHLLDHANIPPMVDQIEFHPGYLQEQTVSLCKKEKIQVEAWSPLGNGVLAKNAFMQKIASHYGKDVGQLCLRFCLQMEVIPMSKSLNPERIRANREIFDFMINEQDMERLRNMPETGWSGLSPDTYSFPRS